MSTITPCRIGLIRHEVLREVCELHPRITSALRRETLVDAAVVREWMTGIGRRDAYARVAHLPGELVERLRAVGLVEEHTQRFADDARHPFPQVEVSSVDAPSYGMVQRSRSPVKLDIG